MIQLLHTASSSTVRTQVITIGLHAKQNINKRSLLVNIMFRNSRELLECVVPVIDMGKDFFSPTVLAEDIPKEKNMGSYTLRLFTVVINHSSEEINKLT